MQIGIILVYKQSKWLLRQAVIRAIFTGFLVLFPSTLPAAGGDSLVPVLSLLLSGERAPVTTLSVGQNHNCVVLEDGKIACWGYNLFGQLGNGTDDSTSSPRDVRGINTATAVGAGVLNTCAVTNGTARCWGNNGSGQLGNNTSGAGTESFVPVAVNGITTGRSMSSGDQFSCVNLTNNSVQCWGHGTSGQLGNNASGSGANRDEPASVVLASYDAISISTGGRHACMVDTSLVAFAARCWGRNTSGQLGDGTNTLADTPDNLVRNSADSGTLFGINDISAGDDHTCASFSSGVVFCWGSNGSGQIGQTANAPTSSNLPVQVSEFGPSLAIANAISAGGDHSCALTGDDKVWCWGKNTYGQLGRGSSGVADHIPVAVSGINTAIAVGSGEFHSCALLSDRSVRCWGRNQHGQLGVAGPAMSNVPVKVSGLTELTGP
jgi:alpha-tubulin suppressor-like RCC1 family protein